VGSLNFAIPVSVQTPQVPISDTFTAFPKSQQLENSARVGLQAVDQVIDIPQNTLSQIPIVQARSNASYYGKFRYYKNGKPVDVLLNPSGPHPELTTVHELGHFIDLDGIGTKGKFSSRLGEITGWKNAVTNSQAYQDLKKLKAAGSVDINGVIRPVNKKYLKYTLTDEELFARSFSQYISTKSGDTILLRQLEKIRLDPKYGAIQWSDSDFDPILKAFDLYFKSIGWLK